MIDDQTVCIANIGPKERRKRLYTGLALSLVILAALVLTGVDRWWRLHCFYRCG